MKIIEKAKKVVYSCENITQAKAALRYLDLIESQYPDVEVYELRKELDTLFSNSVYELI